MSKGIFETIKMATEATLTVFLFPLAYLAFATIGIGTITYFSIFDQ